MSRGSLLLLALVAWLTIAFAVVWIGFTQPSARPLVPWLLPLVRVCGAGAIVLVASAAVLRMPFRRPPLVYESAVWALVAAFMLEIASLLVAATLALPVAGLLLALPVIAYVGYWVPRPRRRVAAAFEGVVAGAPAEVFRLAADPSAAPRLMPEMRGSEIIGDGGLRKGSRLRARVDVGSVRLVAVDEVVEYDPPSRIAYRTLSGAPANLATFTFEPVPGGTRVAFSYVSLLSIASAVIGGWRRAAAARRIVECRSRWVDALRRELEGDSEPSTG